MPNSTFSIHQIKAVILPRARERQASIERGEYDVPLCYRPLPLSQLLDYLLQWEYRRDSLQLAVPPPVPGFAARLGRFCKRLVCSGLRWLLIRQVEFNTAALQHGRVVADNLALVDQNQAELVAALTTLKMQVHTLTERVTHLETARSLAGHEARPSIDRHENAEEALEAHQAYLDHLNGDRRDRLCLVLGSGRGDLLKFLISEGISAQGIETDPELIEHCRERELPVVGADFIQYLDGLEDDTLGGIVLERRACAGSAEQLRDLLGRCWRKLNKGGVVIAETDNPRHGGTRDDLRPPLPVELMHFLFESQCFHVVDTIFSSPMCTGPALVTGTSGGEPFDQKRYRRYAVVGCK